MSLLSGLFGNTLIVGIEDDPDEPDMLRVYIGHRGDWNFVLASGDEAEKVRRAFGANHLTTTLPPDAVVYHDPVRKAEARRLADERWERTPSPAPKGEGE